MKDKTIHSFEEHLAYEKGYQDAVIIYKKGEVFRNKLARATGYTEGYRKGIDEAIWLMDAEVVFDGSGLIQVNRYKEIRKELIRLKKISKKV